MIAGLAVAGQTFKNPEYSKAATRAAEFLLTNLRTKDGRLLRTYGKTGDGKAQAKLTAYLDDYAYLVHGLFCLHDATNDSRWLTEAKSLTDAMAKWYGDDKAGGFFFTASDAEKLFARAKDFHDGVQPSGNSTAAGNLVRLWQKTGDDQYRKLAEKTIKQFAGVLRASPGSVPALGEALHDFLAAGGKKAEPATQSTKDDKRVTTTDVVHATGTLGPPDKDGKRPLTVTLKIDKPWHIYANPVGHDELEGARTTVEVFADGKKVPTKVDYPKGSTEKDDKGAEYRVFEGEVSIAGTVTAGEAKELEVRIKVQACTSGENGRCLLGTTLKVPVK
jgi:hypothetical protein